MGSELNGGRGQLYLRISIHITRMGILQRARENESDDGQKGQGERERELIISALVMYILSVYGIYIYFCFGANIYTECLLSFGFHHIEKSISDRGLRG